MNNEAEMAYHSILQRLQSLANPEAVLGMARFGIVSKRAYGVSIPNLRKLAREEGKEHDLAQRLWADGARETRILATMIDDPKLVTEEQMEQWVRDFDNWETCDNCCGNLFDKTPFAWRKAAEWSSRQEEFIKRAAFSLMASLAVHDKKAPDKAFEEFLPIIEREAGDPRNFVKKAVSWALRQIGKRSLSLNAQAIETARRIHKAPSPAARWVASNALRELTSPAVQARLRGKGTPTRVAEIGD